MRVIGEVTSAVIERLADARRAATLEDVLAWAHARGFALIDLIVQDEFTHDVLVRGPAPVFLCFDTT